MKHTIEGLIKNISDKLTISRWFISPLYDGENEESKALIEIKEILELRIPKKPIDTKCPNCNSENTIMVHEEEFGRYFERSLNYCNDCGQKLDWGEEK